MPTITLRAHFDGKKIMLDEDFELKPDTHLLITVLQQPDRERTEWLNLSTQGLAAAYSKNEPDYSRSNLSITS